MRLTIQIQDQKADFVLELLSQLGSIISVEKADDALLPIWHGEELVERLRAYRQNPQATDQWEEAAQELAKL